MSVEGFQIMMATFPTEDGASGAMDVLKDMGCDQAQGYFIARPAPPDELITFLESKAWVMRKTEDEA